jgi:hypothetical protein
MNAFGRSFRSTLTLLACTLFGCAATGEADDTTGNGSGSGGTDGNGGPNDGGGGNDPGVVGGGNNDGGGSNNAGDGCTAVDLLFVVDNSASMGSHQEALAAAFPGFVDAMFTNLPPDTDLHVGVVTTDGFYTGDCSESTSNCVSDHSESEILGKFFPPTSGNDGMNGTQGRLFDHQGFRYFETNTSDANSGLKAWFAGAATAAGESGCSIEMPSAAAGYVAHASNAATNGGFIRDEGAVLLVFVLTDEPDKSPEPVSSYVDMLVSAKSECGGANCILTAGLVDDFCYDNAADSTLKTFLNSFGNAATVSSIGSPFPFDPAPDYTTVVGEALAKVIEQKCDEIPPPR